MSFKYYARYLTIIREAISMVQVLKVDQPSEADSNLEHHETARRQRLYCELYIQERFLTLNSGFPSVLPPLPLGMPTSDHTLSRHVDVGFNRIYQLFVVIDDTFLRHWNALQFPGGPVPR